MLRNTQESNTQEFAIEGETLTVSKVHGPIALKDWANGLAAEEDPVTKFQGHQSFRFSKLPFFKSKVVDDQVKMQSVLYTNGPHQRSLIVSDGKNHYFYDLVKGAAASFDVKEALGAGLIDVSGKESRKYLEDTAYDVGKAREISARHLPDIETAIRYAMQQIKAVQKQPEHTRRAGLGSSAGG